MSMLLNERLGESDAWDGDGVWDGDQASALLAYSQLQDQRASR